MTGVVNIGVLIQENVWLENRLSQSQEGDRVGAGPIRETGCGGQRPKWRLLVVSWWILPTASQHKRTTYISCCIYRVAPPDDEQQAFSKHVDDNYW